MDVRFFYCYSVELRNFIQKNGKRYLLCALNPNNQKMFWLFERDERLDEILTKWAV